jgi:hypothetical protein
VEAEAVAEQLRGRREGGRRKRREAAGGATRCEEGGEEPWEGREAVGEQ